MKNQINTAVSSISYSLLAAFSRELLPTNRQPILGRYVGLVGAELDIYQSPLLGKVFSQRRFGYHSHALLDQQAASQCQEFANQMLTVLPDNYRLFTASFAPAPGQNPYELLLDVLEWMSGQGVSYVSVHEQIWTTIESRNPPTTFSNQKAHEKRFYRNRIRQNYYPISKLAE